METQWLPLAAYWLSQKVLVLSSYWLNQATVFFILGCHMLSAYASWKAIGRWGKCLTLSLFLCLIALVMRMVVQIRAYDPNTIIQQGLAGELFFWSLTAFLSALAVGYTLRKTMTELFCIDSFLP